MIRRLFISAFLFLILGGCAHLSTRETQEWPSDIKHLEAFCDVSINWSGMRYSGSMSIVVDNRSVYMELYGPFNNTLMMLQREGSSFLFVTKDEAIKDEEFFVEKYKINIDEFIKDITMQTGRSSSGYRVTNTFENGRRIACFEGQEGSICITFLEVSFTKQKM